MAAIEMPIDRIARTTTGCAKARVVVSPISSSRRRPNVRRRGNDAKPGAQRGVCRVRRAARLHGLRPRSPRVRVLGWRVGGRTARRRLPPDRADRREGSRCQLSHRLRSRRARHRSFDVVVIGSANLDLVVRSPRIPGPGETLIGDFVRRVSRRQGTQSGRCRRTQRRPRRASSARSATTMPGPVPAPRRRRRRCRHDRGRRRSPTASTGRALITVGDDGENTIVVVPGANAAVRVDGIPDCRVVLAQLEMPLDSVIAAFVAAKRAWCDDDPQPGPGRHRCPSELLAVTDVIVPNEHEIELVGGVDTPARPPACRR